MRIDDFLTTRIEESAKMGFTFYIEKYSDGVFDGAEDREA